MVKNLSAIVFAGTVPSAVLGTEMTNIPTIGWVRSPSTPTTLSSGSDGAEILEAFGSLPTVTVDPSLGSFAYLLNIPDADREQWERSKAVVDWGYAEAATSQAETEAEHLELTGNKVASVLGSLVIPVTDNDGDSWAADLSVATQVLESSLESALQVKDANFGHAGTNVKVLGIARVVDTEGTRVSGKFVVDYAVLVPTDADDAVTEDRVRWVMGRMLKLYRGSAEDVELFQNGMNMNADDLEFTCGEYRVSSTGLSNTQHSTYQSEDDDGMGDTLMVAAAALGGLGVLALCLVCKSSHNKIRKGNDARDQEPLFDAERHDAKYQDDGVKAAPQSYLQKPKVASSGRKNSTGRSLRGSVDSTSTVKSRKSRAGGPRKSSNGRKSSNDRKTSNGRKSSNVPRKSSNGRKSTGRKSINGRKSQRCEV